jgi:DNA-binding LacI/PurR family transcriptional regulator
VQKAIDLLLERKVLVGRGPNRRPAVALPTGLAINDANRRSLLVISEKSLRQMRQPFSSALQLLQQRCRDEGHDCNIIDCSGASGGPQRKLIHAAMTRYKPSHCVTIQPSKCTYAVLTRAQIKHACLYGSHRSKQVQRLGHCYGPLLTRVFKELTTLGHRRIFIPLLGRKQKPDDSFFEACKKARAQRVKVEVKRGHEPLSHAGMESCLDEARLRGATAVVFPQWGDFLYAITYFAKNGLEIPRDISVVILVCQEEARYFAPPLAGHMVYTPDALSEQVMDWLERGEVDHGILNRSLEQGWERAGSIGPAPSDR